MRFLVVCGFFEVIATFSPRSALSSVDFPTFGRPTIAMNPVLVILFSETFRIFSVRDKKYYYRDHDDENRRYSDINPQLASEYSRLCRLMQNSSTSG